MKRFTTILCSIAFAIFGMGLAITGLDAPNLSKALSANANGVSYTVPSVLPKLNVPSQIPFSNGLNDTKDVTIGEPTVIVDSSLVDSLSRRIKYLEKKSKQVTKVKWRNCSAPLRIVQKDTIRVPVYYLATQVGNKEGPTGSCISLYEISKVKDICPEKTNSSITHAPQHDSDVND